MDATRSDGWRLPNKVPIFKQASSDACLLEDVSNFIKSNPELMPFANSSIRN
jgi:hypothetical protein